MKQIRSVILIILLASGPLFSIYCQHNVHEGYKLIWSDEFEYSGLPDSSKWGFETKGNAHGWGNNEKQFYTERNLSNAVVEDGVLKIIARKEQKENKNYTSARLSSQAKAAFKYGLIEARAKLPAGKGTWPAIWMLGSNRLTAGWPDCGEIDIMEHVGYEPDSVHGTIHTAAYNHIKGTQKGGSVFIEDPYSAFHVYGIEWTPDRMDFLLDGKVYYYVENEHLSDKEWPFDQPFYLIMNVAIGGNWGGKKGIDDSIFPVEMIVDWVRVYQKD
ncbi:MAG TPA: glycoside hydrolase [Saprospirales bacterium]|nr:glycoside hydrolase [Saprospirales bacterium]HAY70556.1 glycoside hydrolase [Saprospirales bacterium]HRQ29858.1 glycoside hydrolase family 16 protein [Saprospiraceae bacterium]